MQRTTFVLCLLFAQCAGARAQSSETMVVLPQKATLHGAQATLRLLVEQKQGEQYTGDLTAKAVFTSSNPKVATVRTDGTVQAVRNGTATIAAIVNGQKATATVQIISAERTSSGSFRNHILPILTKASCNSGACHGAAAGKGGLKLTLRGYDPDADYNVLTRQASGRRVVAGKPEASLLLLKPTMQIAHGGGKRMDAKSPDYAVLKTWITTGLNRPSAADPQIEALEVYPARARLKKGDTQRILVRACYTNGQVEDVTRWVKFGTSESSVALVDDLGKVTVQGNGEAAITVWFNNKVTFARIVCPFPGAPGAEDFARAERTNFIDDLVLRKLHALNIPPSPQCSDSEFIRRAYLDTAGILPTAREVEAFLADAAPDKRARLVDALLKRPEFVDYWTYKWSDLLLVSSRKLSGGALTAFSHWIRQSVQENKPWNTFVREILTAKGSNLENGAVNFFVLHKEPIDLTETTTQAFLGMSLTCARCHNHPMEKWTQRDYYQMANLLSRVRLKNGDQPGEVLALPSPLGNINHPRLGIPLAPRPLEGRTIALEDTRDRRETLADWLTAPDNPYFAKALINRVWKNFLGRGLVEAEDDLRLTNPPSNQELFDALEQDFVRNGYDVQRLIRAILLSATYQRSAEPVPGNEKDDRFYSRYIVRRLSAEVLLDAISQVTASPTEFMGYPKGLRALQLPDSVVASPFLTTFGRPDRVQTCSCERQQEPSIAQALHLANGDTLNQKLRASGNALDSLLQRGISDEAALRELYLSALSRLPMPSEQAKALAVLNESGWRALKTPEEQTRARRAVMEDLFWAVLTEKEFLFNH
jgi:hypothetical protein